MGMCWSSGSVCELAELRWPAPLPLVRASADGYGEGAKTGSACFGRPRTGPHFPSGGVRVIRSFGNKDTDRLWLRERVRPIDPTIHRDSLRKLRHLGSAESLEDLRIPPGNRFKALEGDRAGQYSIRSNEIVHGKRRITADTALRLAKRFGTSTEFWINLQSHYEPGRAEGLHGEQIAAQAKEHVRSIEAEVRAILTRASRRPHIGTALLTAAQDVGGVDDLPIPVRDNLARTVSFSDGGRGRGGARL